MDYAKKISEVPRKIWRPPKPGEPEPIATLLDGQDLITTGTGGVLPSSEKTTVLVQNYRPGGAHKEHAHGDAEQVFFVFRGRGQFMLDDRWFDVSEGDLIYVPRGVNHAARNSSDGELTIIFISTPLPPMSGD